MHNLHATIASWRAGTERQSRREGGRGGGEEGRRGGGGGGEGRIFKKVKIGLK